MTKEAAAANRPLVERPGCGAVASLANSLPGVVPDHAALPAAASASVALATALAANALEPAPGLANAVLALDALEPAAALPAAAPQENSGSAVRAAAAWPLAAMDTLSGMA
jgi:hypothetical protein